MRNYDKEAYAFIKRVEAAHRQLFDLGQRLAADGMKFDNKTYKEFIEAQTSLVVLATDMRKHEMAKKETRSS